MSDISGPNNSLTSIFEDILALQPEWASTNTTAMDRRGRLVRSDARTLVQELLEDLHWESDELAVEASDGRGSKARIPWVRVYSKKLSPTATVGWYVVYLFASDGSAVYLALGQGSQVLTGNGFRPRPGALINTRVEWARATLAKQNANTAGMLTEIELKDPGGKGEDYENCGAYAIRYNRSQIPNDVTLRDDLQRMIDLLAVLYNEQATETTAPNNTTSVLLEGFTSPVAYVKENVQQAPSAPGVHVVWTADGQALYVGQTKELRERMIRHLSGEREGSVLRQKVSRLLADDSGTDASGAGVRTYLAGCTVAWKTTDDPASLKRSLIEELHPVFNELLPTGGSMRDPRVMVVYVADATEVNFRFGLNTGTWGFPNAPEHEQLVAGDWILFARGFTGGSPRTTHEIGWLMACTKLF